jgi:hypothetical protein
MCRWHPAFQEGAKMRFDRRTWELVVLGLLFGFGVYVCAPAFWERQYHIHRDKVAREKSEMRNLQAFLECYYIDNERYPPAMDMQGNLIPYADDGSGISAGYVPWVLTTPTAYVTRLPSDPFHRLRNDEYGPYRYATDGLHCWIMTANGPDRKPDIPIEEYPRVGRTGYGYRKFMSHFGEGSAVQYDGSNGTVSGGDVVRVGP